MGEYRPVYAKLNFYKHLLKFLPIFIVLVVLPRVASFLALLGNEPGTLDIHDLIRWAFAVALGLGVVATAYFSQHVDIPEYEEETQNPREIKRRKKEAAYFAAINNVVPVARGALTVFAILDGLFNLGDALFGANANGLFDANRHGPVLATVYAIVTVTFGIAPTLLNIVLTRVIAAVDKIPLELENKSVRTVLTSEQIEQRSTHDVRKMFAPNSEQAPNTRRTLPNGEQGFDGHRTGVRQGFDRTPTEHRTGEQSNRIIEYLNRHYAEQGSVPSISTVIEALGEPRPSRSTVSVTTNAWKQQVGIGDASSNVRG